MPQRRRGFTLIEMLVVLMIMGLFVGLVSAILRPDDRAVLQLEAERLAELLNLAAAEARLSGQPIAWSADESGYRFWRSGDDELWSEIGDSEMLRARTLPPGMALGAFRVENTPAQATMRLEFSPRGSALAFTIALSLGTQRFSIVGSPIGEMRALPGESRTDGGMALR
jgi:general secretion pathway protein H